MTTAEEIVTRHLAVAEDHRGQLRFAERFARAYGGELLFVHGIGWHTWDGARWAECVDGEEHRAVIALVKYALAEMPRLSMDDRKMMLQDVGKVESAAGIGGTLELASTIHTCTLAATRLDASPYLLNTKAGTVDIEAGTMSVSNPSDHLSKVTNARFEPDARSEEFDRFLAQTQPDPEMRAFLARSLGSALLGVVREHVLLIWYGRGANGKGTLRDAVAHALGDYGIEIPADLLLQSRHAANLAPERMRLKGARVSFCSEIAEGAKLDEATMKKLTGGDPVNAKLLYRNPVQFDPSHTLVMLTNHLPKVRGDDPATWRRILAVPFDNVVPEGQRDGELPSASRLALRPSWRGYGPGGRTTSATASTRPRPSWRPRGSTNSTPTPSPVSSPTTPWSATATAVSDRQTCTGRSSAGAGVKASRPRSPTRRLPRRSRPAATPRSGPRRAPNGVI